MNEGQGVKHNIKTMLMIKSFFCRPGIVVGIEDLGS